MNQKTLNLELSNDQFADLANALEDHRDYFKKRADEAMLGFGLDTGYWTSRSQEVQELLDLVLLNARQDH
ncbi:hypothetical protein AOZ07_16640 [Glutamicibacter halophytocola]|uniref:hypothetical protein n=1 Tax=Glutamicibacter TaxID=1742989 RepID=UPI0006D4AA3D|nr:MULTISPECIES: hypothetical protein [Glutamicibacter]ALG30446.1 hypothetical protein AOZ07_16640 [Glutamicibacter halophytocola]MBF6670368.1 hypothetical protein [Glutamicibacter sp. FBE19]NQD39325.1 hypothetical protein [Glutamicibacter halophytocola]